MKSLILLMLSFVMTMIGMMFQYIEKDIAILKERTRMFSLKFMEKNTAMLLKKRKKNYIRLSKSFMISAENIISCLDLMLGLNILLKK